MFKKALILSFIFALLAVVIGAFGAHGLKPLMTPETFDSFETGVKYQFYHAFALAITGILYLSFPSKKIITATWFFSLGIVLFSGSIYLLTYLKSTQEIGLGKLGLITPIGGLCFIAGWLFLIFAVVSKKD